MTSASSSRPLIARAASAVVVGRGRDDAVDHRAGERDVGARSTRPARRPPASGRARQKSPHQASTTVPLWLRLSQHSTVTGPASRSRRRCRPRTRRPTALAGAAPVDVGPDERVGQVEPPVRAAAVALLGDGQRDHRDGGVGQPVQHVVGLRRPVEHLADDAGDPQRRRARPRPSAGSRTGRPAGRAGRATDADRWVTPQIPQPVLARGERRRPRCRRPDGRGGRRRCPGARRRPCSSAGVPGGQGQRRRTR